MNLLDLLALGYIAWRARRGYRRGFVAEFPSAASISIFFLCGWGLFKIMYRGLEQASAALGLSAGLGTFMLILIGSVLLVRRLKYRFGWVAERIVREEKRKKAGAIAAGVAGVLLVAVVMFVLAHGARGWVEGSLIGGGLLRWILPVYQQAH